MEAASFLCYSKTVFLDPANLILAVAFGHFAFFNMELVG